MSIKETMSRQHRLCDESFVKAEAAVAKKNWVQAEADFSAFRAMTSNHFQQEEQILFPEFEAETGMTSGPTQMMRMEHEQMRHLFDDLSQALLEHDRSQYLGLSETLMMIMQQHNMKEEQILYPMTDRALADRAESILGRMNLD